MKIRRSYILALAVAGCFFMPAAMAQNNIDARPTAGSDVVQNCKGCHGVDGNSQVNSTPRLNGQQADYLADRLKTLSTMARNNPHLKLGMFKDLSTKNAAAQASAAKYFSEFPPTASKTGVRALEGQRIYQNGLVSENVIGCAQCHGPRGEGHDATPRLTGQHSAYLIAQLQLFNLKFRKHVLMNPNTATMSKNTMEALSAYLAND